MDPGKFSDCSVLCVSLARLTQNQGNRPCGNAVELFPPSVELANQCVFPVVVDAWSKRQPLLSEIKPTQCQMHAIRHQAAEQRFHARVPPHQPPDRITDFQWSRDLDHACARDCRELRWWRNRLDVDEVIVPHSTF